MLVIITGPAGAGKTSVGEALANKFPKSANFSVDTIRHFIRGGYVDPWDDTDEIGQSILATKIAQGIIKRYLENGYTVIIDDVIDDQAVEDYKVLFPETLGFLLLPSLEVAQARDQQRPTNVRMGSRVDEMHRDFIAGEHNVLTIIDSSNQTVTETVDAIYDHLV